MTAAERLQAEKERLLTTTGFYVPPYRMANLMKAAAKIMDIIIKADTNICYEECRFIMAIVDAAIPRVWIFLNLSTRGIFEPIRLHTMNPVVRENIQRLIERY